MPALDQYLSIADLESAARRRMPACVRGYVCGGTEDGASLQESLQAFQLLQEIRSLQVLLQRLLHLYLREVRFLFRSRTYNPDYH